MASAAGMRYVLWIFGVAVAYMIFAKVGFSLAFGIKQVTAVWPPTGIAIAVLLLGGYRMWPGIWLGAFVSNALTAEPLFTAAGIAVGNTLGPLLGAYLLRRLVHFDAAFQRVRDVIGLVVCASILGMTVTATNGVAQLALAGIVPWTSYRLVWPLWWAGDAMGVLLVAPLILTWSVREHPVVSQKRSAPEVIALALAVLVITWLSFMSRLPVAYPVYPFVIWTALRFGQRATTLAIATISVIAIVGTTHDLGPFTGGSLDHRLFLLVTFMAILSVTGLVLGAVTTERQLVRQQLGEAEHRFQVLAELVPQMVWTANATGWIDWYNQRWYDYTGQSVDEAAGWGWQRAHHAEDFQRVMQEWPQCIATGKPFDIESRIRGSDGSLRWFLTRAEPLRDAAGSIVRWYGTNTDIDHQKLALQQTTRVAEALQAAFVPLQLPTQPHLRFDVLYVSAEREALIGGDWYDAFELPDGRIVVSIGDVIGHGLEAAVTAGRIRQSIFTLAFDVSDPATILNKANTTLGHQEDKIATALVAILERDHTSMRYASAGHPPPMLGAGSAGSEEQMPYGGPPLGAVGNLTLSDHVVRLEHNALVLFYTDGLTEFKRDIITAERTLQAALASSAVALDAHPAEMLQRAVMGAESPSDDTVLLVLQLGAADGAEVPAPPEVHKHWAFRSSDGYSAHVSRHDLMAFIRHFISSEEDLFRTELIIGEILANIVEHAPGLVHVDIRWQSDHAVMTVRDSGPGLRYNPGLPQEALTERGRGLFLIGMMADAVQVQSQAEGGTIMTVVLPSSASKGSTAPQP
ncbi:MAG: MASE1 domain-containing protein [Candidatus Eremiobacteraeota bacterium]|nr:MASE1 domain-containing protein [Candidatus Eremiobacteraeota bacterium]